MRAQFMELALQLAETALQEGEVPVGCVIVNEKTSKVIATGYNQPNLYRDATRHAEIVAFDQIYDQNSADLNQSLKDCSLYVTVEPCIMCAAAILYSTIPKVYFGCRNERFGGCCSTLNVPALLPSESSTTQNKNQCETPVQQFVWEEGFYTERAIQLLKLFYDQENRWAPDPKKKQKTSTSIN
eukprot:TRINITY_DN2401_c0_g2_i1.p1 TRINITY_DN2401_c0_g2~~TRINITY_DN2401_c0_g2_i1.p1  ORF type:complete len:184 (-),score=36.54 TRINITY_DN2401_c0_g2_i1:106-657(-)